MTSVVSKVTIVSLIITAAVFIVFLPSVSVFFGLFFGYRGERVPAANTTQLTCTIAQPAILESNICCNLFNCTNNLCPVNSTLPTCPILLGELGFTHCCLSCPTNYFAHFYCSDNRPNVTCLTQCSACTNVSVLVNVPAIGFTNYSFLCFEKDCVDQFNQARPVGSSLPCWYNSYFQKTFFTNPGMLTFDPAVGIIGFIALVLSACSCLICMGASGTTMIATITTLVQRGNK